LKHYNYALIVDTVNQTQNREYRIGNICLLSDYVYCPISGAETLTLRREGTNQKLDPGYVYGHVVTGLSEKKWKWRTYLFSFLP